MRATATSPTAPGSGTSSARPGRPPHRWQRRSASAVLVLALAGCARPEPAPTRPDLAAPPGAPALRVGTSFDYPPFSTLDQPAGGGEATPTGFSIDLAHRLAAALGRPLELVDFEWPELGRDIAAGRFDVAISGVTWRPERAAVGRMSRALAAGGPCTVARSELTSEQIASARVAVNRGGILERWARSHWPDPQLVITGNNLRLPELLATGEVDLFVTDRFEVAHFAAPADLVRCEPPADRKVIWIAPTAESSESAALGDAIDRWLEGHEDFIAALRLEHFGDPMPRDPADHLVDLLARRLAFMPLVALDKRSRGLEIEDAAQEERVLASALEAATGAGLSHDAASRATVERFFRMQIELAKQIQERTLEASETAASGDPESAGDESLRLEQIRPALLVLGDQLIAALASTSTAELEALRGDADRMAPLREWLAQEDVDRLLQACAEVVEAGGARRTA
ncbi:MAG: hypothetical protein DWQ36_19935 [Acidobacteria bacterium]|nr:MAG: hypothetical protein DWQ30_02930 [Acidobacteriota bacterium]REK03622.1 MAG: hypothetical protein DWQ36_19935 [Acidobacteriota bacterium]